MKNNNIFPDIPWIDTAKAEFGQKEIKGSKSNPRILEYHSSTTIHTSSDEVAWCSSFVNWCLKQVKITGTNSAVASSWLKWGKEVAPGTIGAITIIYQAKAAGSSLTQSGNHVGFLIEETKTHIELLGGNQSDQVRVSRYPKKSWRIRGYRWPEWQLDHKTTSTPESDKNPCKVYVKPMVIR